MSTHKKRSTESSKAVEKIPHCDVKFLLMNTIILSREHLDQLVRGSRVEALTGARSRRKVTGRMRQKMLPSYYLYTENECDTINCSRSQWVKGTLWQRGRCRCLTGFTKWSFNTAQHQAREWSPSMTRSVGTWLVTKSLNSDTENLLLPPLVRVQSRENGTTSIYP